MELNDLLAKLTVEYDVPGAALGVLADGEVRDAAAGVLNRRTGVAATTGSLFQIGSVTKVYTTTLVLALADAGLLSLDDPVRRHVPELRLRDESVAAALTVRHLLNHTSGLPGDYFPDTGRGDDCLQRYPQVLADVELGPPLGTLFSYSNAAFSLAGLVVERVTGQTWDAALRERLLQPLGLTGTVTLPEEALLHSAAVGHLGLGDEQRVAPIWALPRNCGPAGAIAATARDVLAFARLHLDGGTTPDGTRVLDPASVRAMQQQTVAVPGGSQGRAGFGLGWGLGVWDGARVLQHDGGTIGQAAALRVLPEAGVAVALLTNGGDWMGFRDAVLAEVVPAVAGVRPPAPLTPTTEDVAVEVEELVGTYRNMGGEVTLSRDGDTLLFAQRADDELEALAGDELVQSRLHPQAPDLFLLQLPRTGGWIPLMVVRGNRGQVEYVHVGGRAARRVAG